MQLHNSGREGGGGVKNSSVYSTAEPMHLKKADEMFCLGGQAMLWRAEERQGAECG